MTAHPSIHHIPEAWLDDPMFDELEPDQCVQLVMLWRSRLDDGQRAKAVEVVSGWIQDRELFSGLKHDEDEVAGFVGTTSLGSWGLKLTLVNVAQPRVPLAALVERLQQAGIGLCEALAGVNVRDEDGNCLPAPDPRSPERLEDYDMAKFWRAAFDPQSPSPVPEMIIELADVLGDELTELRLTELRLDGLRICYATPTPNFLEPSPRSGEVSKVVRSELDRVFGALKVSPDEACEPPHFFDRTGETNDVAERIFRSGRVGYSLAFPLQSLQAVYAKDFRYREHELLVALRGAILQLGLEPVVLWRRYGSGDEGGHCEVQLWERAEAAESREAVASIAKARQEAVASGDLTVLPTVAPVTPPADALRPGPELGLAEGIRVIESPRGARVALVPSEEHEGMDTLALVSGKELRPLEAPPSARYQDPECRSFSFDGKRLFVLTDVTLRSIDLSTGQVTPLMIGSGYRQVVCLADDLAVVRGNSHPVRVSTEEPDVAGYLESQGIEPDGPWIRCEAISCLWLVDLRSTTELNPQVISGMVRQLMAVHGGRVLLAHGADSDAVWRTAVLAVKGRRLRLVARIREALVDAFDQDGRVLSSNACEAINLDVVAGRMEDDEEDPDLEDPDLTE
jgi:hypothetical protein